MTQVVKPAEFLRSWTEGNLPAFLDPSLRAGKAKNLAHQCRVDAETVGIRDADLDDAAGGNLVAYFQDLMASSLAGGSSLSHDRA